MTSVLPPARTAAAGLLTVRQLLRVEDGEELPALLWDAGPGWRMISSAVLGGGLGPRAWVLNAQVAHGYRRPDPDRHLAELARAAGAAGPGVGLMTAAEVRGRAHAEDGGAEAVVTSGVSVRGWAAAPPVPVRGRAAVPGGSAPAQPGSAPAEPGSAASRGSAPAQSGSAAAPQGSAAPPESAPAPGTINILAALPVALTDSALVNAVATATEAKVQALLDLGYDCSGTPTDAVCVAAREPRPGDPLHAFAGPRSPWGARLARAVHQAVREATPAP
ncbi:adenosylcobinamide amidohydrolase [Streptomyces sp. NPDC046887]|uniref:adenosylcobinamide amidohydrolase n=1 Tax=Streptomyces sp. NPDC046887 TaxID=3155472 RepID=UPI0033C16E3F